MKGIAVIESLRCPECEESNVHQHASKGGVHMDRILVTCQSCGHEARRWRFKKPEIVLITGSP